MYRALPESPDDRTRVTVTVPLAGNPVTVTCGGTDMFYGTDGVQSIVLTTPLLVVTLEYFAAGGSWYAVEGRLPSGEEPPSRSELTVILGEILDDYHSGTGTFGVGGHSMRPETLALIIAQRIRRKRG
jgi:hypothetical protein